MTAAIRNVENDAESKLLDAADDVSVLFTTRAAHDEKQQRQPAGVLTFLIATIPIQNTKMVTKTRTLMKMTLKTIVKMCYIKLSLLSWRRDVALFDIAALIQMAILSTSGDFRSHTLSIVVPNINGVKVDRHFRC